MVKFLLICLLFLMANSAGKARLGHCDIIASFKATLAALSLSEQFSPVLLQKS